MAERSGLQSHLIVGSNPTRLFAVAGSVSSSLAHGHVASTALRLNHRANERAGSSNRKNVPFARARLRVRVSLGTFAGAVVPLSRCCRTRGPRSSVSVESFLCKEDAVGSNPTGSISDRSCSVAQLGRASPWHGEGRGFKSHRVHRFGSGRRETSVVEAPSDARVGVVWSITDGCQPLDECSDRLSRTAVSVPTTSPRRRARSALVM